MAFSLLLVEDDPDEIALVSMIFKKYFPSWSYVVISEYTELIEYLSTNSVVSFILLDMHLPEKDGLTLLSEIRQMKWYNHIPIAGYSSASSPATISMFLANGGDYFFEKPCSLDEIVSQLKQLPSLQPKATKTIKIHRYPYVQSVSS